jgi:predicted nucleotidyltransferase
MLHTTSGFVGREEAKREEAKPAEKPKRTKKTVVVAATPEITEVVPIPMEEVKPIAKPKRSIKKVIKPKMAVIGIVEVAADDIPVTKIQVKKEEIGGRSVYVAETKDKVYDLSYAYLGRWNRKEGRIETAFPDSDAEP